MPVELKEAGQKWATHAFNRAVEMGHPTPDVLTSLIYETSRFNPGAAGYEGTIGIGRFTPEQAASLQIDPKDPYQAIDAVIALDKQNLEDFQDRDAATAAFFYGPEQVAAVAESGENAPPEIIAKVQRVNQNAGELGRLPQSVDIEMFQPPMPEKTPVDRLLKAEAAKVDMETQYARAQTREIEPVQFITEYLGQKFEEAGVKV